MAKASAAILIILLLCFTYVFSIPKVKANPGYENFVPPNYTEVDPNNHLSQTTNRANFTGLKTNEDCYLYKDKGVDHFGDFGHDFAFSITGRSTGQVGRGNIWVLNNELDDAAYSANATMLMAITHTSYPNLARVDLYEKYLTVSYADTGSSWELDWGTTYYVRVIKDGTSLVAAIYSTSGYRDAGDGTDGDIENYALTLHVDHQFRYVGTSWSWNNGVNGDIDGYVENLDLHEALYTVTFFYNSGGILRVDCLDTANGTETSYLNNTEIELSALVEGNLTYGFDNFTWNGNYNYSNPYDWTIVYGVSNVTLWCYFGVITGDIVEERAFGTLGFVVAVIALAIGVVVLAGKKLL